MAQVPNLSLVPEVMPQSQPLPSIRVDTPDAAFGGATARALQSFGHQLERSGDELFARAQALQDLKNESEVNLKTSEYIQETGKLDNAFRLLSGNQPQEKLEEHVKALTELRAANRASLSNPMAQKRFDSETLRRYSYDVVNASNWAATQFKQYSKATEGALRDSALNDLMKDPNNEGRWNQAVKTMQDTVSQEAALEGESPIVADRKFRAALGQGVLIRAGAMAKHDPERAQKFFDSIKDKLRPEDVDRIQETINDRGVKTNSALISSQIMGGDASLIDRAMRATKAQESGGRYGNVTTTVNKRTGQLQSALGAYGIMETNLASWSKEILGKEVSKEEFLASREIQDAIYRGKMGQYIQKYGVEGAGQAWLGGPGGVGKEDRTDALGTPIGTYGRAFAGLVGPSGEVSQEQEMINKYKLAEKYAEKLYPLAKDPALHERAVTQFKHDISVKASVQQRELNNVIRDLKNQVGVVMNTQTDRQRPPTNLQEANAIDPRFQDKLEQLAKLDPTTYRRMNNWFKANANQDVPYTNEREQAYTRYIGMPTEDRAKYDANEAFVKGEITNARRNDILKDQAKTKHSAEEDVKVDSILRRHNDVLNAIKAWPSRTNSAANARYNQFRGALILELRAAQEGGVPVRKPEEEDRIMQRLVGQEETGDWRFRRLLGIPLPIPGTTVPQTAPRYETESLQYPVTVNSVADVAKLRPGQVYIYNGRKAVVPK